MDTALQVSVGKKIRQLRLESGLTIEELAFRAHLHPNYLGEVERGKRNASLKNLQKIAQSLKKSAVELFSAVRPAKAGSVSEKNRVYLSAEQDKAALALIKSLRGNSEKDRNYIIRVAKHLSAKLKSGKPVRKQ